MKEGENKLHSDLDHRPALIFPHTYISVYNEWGWEVNEEKIVDVSELILMFI